MPLKPRQLRLPAALRSALVQLQAGASPQEVAADLIIKHAERAVLCARFPPGDPRLPAVAALTRALGMRTFDDSAISLDACLRDFQEVGIGGRLSTGRPSVDDVIRKRSRRPAEEPIASLRSTADEVIERRGLPVGQLDRNVHTVVSNPKR